MAIKSANVTARVQPEIKQQAEAILANIGLPVSVLIDTLYRQIIMTGGVPYSLSVPQIPTRDSMTEAQFNAMMEKGYQQAKNGQTMTFIVLAFSELIHVFNIRNNKESIFKIGIGGNKQLFWAIGASAMLMLVILAIPVLRAIFSIPVLPMDRIVETIALVIAPVVIVEIFKLLKINTSKDE